MAVTTIETGRQQVVVRERTSADVGLLFLRLTLGVIFFMHGSQKVLGLFGGHGLADSVAGMGHMGIVAPLAYLSIFTEFLGGLMLILGALTRLAAFASMINMIVAVALVHFKNGFFMNGSSGPGYEYNLALIGMSIALILTGPGALALGDWEIRLFKKPKTAKSGI